MDRYYGHIVVCFIKANSLFTIVEAYSNDG